MLVRIASFITRSRIPLRAMSTIPQDTHLPEKRPHEEDKSDIVKSDSTHQAQNSNQATEKTVTSASKRIKTAKDRKEHFNKKGSWKAQDWATGGKRPVRDGPAPERRPKKKVAVLLGFCGTGYQGMQM